jgi:hypothetical protein
MFLDHRHPEQFPYVASEPQNPTKSTLTRSMMSKPRHGAAPRAFIVDQIKSRRSRLSMEVAAECRQAVTEFHSGGRRRQHRLVYFDSHGFGASEAVRPVSLLMSTFRGVASNSERAVAWEAFRPATSSANRRGQAVRQRSWSTPIAAGWRGSKIFPTRPRQASPARQADILQHSRQG